MARKEAEMIGAGAAETRSLLIEKTRMAVARLWLIDRKKEIASDNLRLLRTVAAVAKKRYEVGAASQSNLLLAEAETETQAADSSALIDERIAADAALAALTGDSGIGHFPVLEYCYPELSIPDSVISQAFLNSPELQMLKAEKDAAVFKLSAVRWSLLPDFVIGSGYKTAPDMDGAWSVMAGVSIPFAPWALPRQRASFRAAQSDLSALDKKMESLRADLRVQATDAYAQARRAQRQMDLQKKSIIPKTELSFRSSLSGYKNGTEEFTMVIENARMLNMAREKYAMAAEELIAAYTRLEGVACVIFTWE
jgi:cobalt-zinc-cadmium efflux system outer membrane protein